MCASRINYCVYWYHLETHLDPYKEGYIGVTKDIKRRHLDHFKPHKRKLRFHKAIELYGKANIKRSILKDGLNKQEAYDLEYQYRPTARIGWNLAIGGDDTCGTSCRQVRLFHKDNPNEEFTFESIVQAADSTGLTEGQIQRALKVKSNSYNCSGWHVMHENTNKETIKDTTISRFKKEVKLSHISEPTNIHTFSSIGQAARLLNISHSWLKNVIRRKSSNYGRNGWRVVDSQDLSNEQVKTS